MGKALAKMQAFSFFDVDSVIEETEGMTVRELYLKRSEEGFKTAELQAVKKILLEIQENNLQGKAVISTGGGICKNNEALSLLRNESIFIFLDVSEEVSINRIIDNSKKTGSYPAYISRYNPKNEDEVKNIYHTFYDERVALYKQLADISISVDTGSDYHASVHENCCKILYYLPNHSI